MGVRVALKPGKEHLGYWVFVVHKNKRRSKLVGDKKEAEKAAKEYRLALARDDLQITRPASTQPHLEAYFIGWLDTQIKPWRKPTTYDNYRLALTKWIAPHLGDTPLDAITRDDVRALIAAWRAAGLARASIKAMLAPLSACLAQAVEDRLIVANPAAKALPKQRGEGKGHTGVALTKAQVQRLLAQCRALHPRWELLVLLWTRTGLRLGEALALRWGDINLTRRCVYVRRTLSYRTPDKHTTTKGGRGEELVDLSKELTRALQGAKPPAAEADDLLFPSRNNTPMNPSNFRERVWNRLFLDAEGKPLPDLPRVRIHDLRHTVATLLLEEGEDLVYVQHLLRHRSIRTTVDEYGHLKPGYNRGAVDRLDS